MPESPNCYAAQSRQNWKPVKDGQDAQASNEQLIVGCLQRMATAAEEAAVAQKKTAQHVEQIANRLNLLLFEQDGKIAAQAKRLGEVRTALRAAGIPLKK